ncbi:hypothetical protein ABZ208_16610 [Streptomyces sp. NPDC006208]|uniref:hypothetical protein n=1 Tax=Streptomyces sp. NPDC006208 TaxID=3156734 RepID=UPI0033A7E68A
MFEYEIQKLRQNELIREADARRLVRQVQRARRAARASAKNAGEDRVNPAGTSRYTRAA